MKLKDWFISKIYTYGDDPSFSLRYQKYYFKLVFKAPIDFNEFHKYYQRTIKGTTIDTRISIVIGVDLLVVKQFMFGDIKEKDKDICVTVWVNKSELTKGFYKSCTGMPPRVFVPSSFSDTGGLPL